MECGGLAMWSRNIIGMSLAAFFLTVCASTSVCAQDKGNSAKPVPAPGGPQTIVGCLTGYEGRYTLGASDDKLYLLDGDTTQFKKYNARMVKITGTVSEPSPETSRHESQQPPTLTVQTLKKVADGCN
jgi:hypothetical protein